MRPTPPLIVGAGPAGCAAAIVLAEAGHRPVLIDRFAEVPDALCGGFLSWRTRQQLSCLGIDLRALGAVSVHRLALFAAPCEATAALPEPGLAISRQALDTAMRARAIAAGCQIEIDSIRELDGLTAIGRRRIWTGNGLFFATGKHDLRGAGRPRSASDATLGLRLRLPRSASRLGSLADTIELHLFERGYAGLVLQEDGTTNVCLAVRKSMLAGSGGNPRHLVASLARNNPAFQARLGDEWDQAVIEAIAAVPYGWLVRRASTGLFRLGDQAAVIPSLAGEGISIAVASGILAAQTWLKHGPDGSKLFQQRLGAAAAPAIRAATLARKIAEHPVTARLGLKVAGQAPAALRWLAQASRVSAPSLAPRAVAS